jgi:C-5 cytosine-specific DNA methylase
MLSHIDLFTGIGGFARALRGISEAVVYCDNCPQSNQVLDRHMREGNLPVAPIVTDVRNLNAATIDVRPELIASSFPCQGLSSMGHRRGLADPRSGLFHEMTRIIDDFEPPLVFLENVPGVLSLAMDTVVDELCKKRGYELRWVILPAYAVGAPHERKRWFALCVRPGYRRSFDDILLASSSSTGSYVPHDFGATPEPARLTHERHDSTRRSYFLGNALVPDCACLAFMILALGFRDLDVSADRLELQTPILVGNGNGVPWNGRGIWPRCGHVTRSGAVVHRIKSPAFVKPNLQLEMTSTVPKVLPKRVTKCPVTNHKMRIWSTPRAGCAHLSSIMTERTIHDLPTQVAFEKSTNQNRNNAYVNPEWLESVMMGFPRDWTRRDA